MRPELFTAEDVLREHRAGWCADECPYCAIEDEELMSKKTDALVTQGTYAVASPGSVSLMQQAFEQGVGVFDLTRIGVPTGGMTVWTVPTIDGEENPRELNCVISFVQARQKAWWAKGLEDGGGGSPPDCTSSDALNGYGNNTEDSTNDDRGPHDCTACRWNQFGSRRGGGDGKDCKDFALMFLFQEGSHMPTLLSVPATSLKQYQKYVMRLLTSGKAIHRVQTRLTLEKAQSNSGIAYSRIAFAFASDMPIEEHEILDEVMRTCKATALQMTPAQRAGI